MVSGSLRNAALVTLVAAFSAFAQQSSPPSAQDAAVAASPTPASIPEAPVTTATVVAAVPEIPAPVGNAAEGKLRVYTCTGCHGIPGYRNVYPSYHVPKIFGQSPQYVVTALMEYRNGTRKHPTMQAQGESLSDQDIADIAAYLASARSP